MLNNNFAKHQQDSSANNDSANLEFLRKLVIQYKPLKELPRIIIETNKIFHSFDAVNYDSEHPEIFEQLPEIYVQMCKFLPQRELTILNYGCGTGFEATQISKNIPNIKLLACYDISDDMLSICKQKLKGDNIQFFNRFDEIPKNVKFDVLVTNSLLHHLPNPMETINDLTDYLSENCCYIMGHEPSARFLKNNELAEIYSDVNLRGTINRIFNIKRYPYYLKRIFRLTSNPYISTAKQVVSDGLFGLEPTPEVIGNLVDACVPTSTIEANSGRGFDFKSIELHKDWKLLFVKTYDFLGKGPVSKLHGIDKKRYLIFQDKYPNDGLNFCCVWQRK